MIVPGPAPTVARGTAPYRPLVARALFRRFHCFDPDRMLSVRCRRRIPRVLVKLGRLRALIYQGDRGHRGRWQTYIHFMERPPLLTCDARGRQLYILGGRYRVTERGIEG